MGAMLRLSVWSVLLLLLLLSAWPAMLYLDTSEVDSSVIWLDLDVQLCTARGRRSAHCWLSCH